jgi:hypothetical protein
MIAVQLANIGLFTYTNLVGQAPPGAMTVAQNIVIDKPGVAETRRGFQQFGSVLGSTVHKMFAFQNRLLLNYGTSMAYDSTGAGVWTTYGGTFSPPTGDKIRGTEANSNFYFTTNNGIYKIDTITNNPYAAGGVQALDVNAALAGAGSGFLAASSITAYRITWVYTDANGNEIEGDPSESVTVTNNGGTSDNTVVNFTVPGDVTTAYFYRVYRAPQTNSLSILPGDTYQLSYQAQVTAGQIAALQVSVTDITPDTLLGEILYTSPGAEGEFQTNDPPPLAYDICTFQGMTFYLNCSTIQQFYITLISAGAPNGIQIGDTISLVGTATRTYTGNIANSYGSQLFAVSTSGSVALNIDTTARNLVGAINQDPGNTEFYAYYVSGFGQLPGQILIEARNLSHAAFSAISSRGGAFSPVVPVSGTSYISSNNIVLNGLYVSKLNQPEAVPVENLLFVGSADQPGYRVYPLRDAVIVQSKGGVFRITGTAPDNLTVSPFDNTVIQYGNDTGVTLNNSVYSYTTQGIISVTESGSQIMSRNVEGDLLTLSAPNVYTNFPSLAFGISYESQRRYILCLGANSSDTVSTEQYVYNWITLAFTTWNLSVTCGIVNPFDNLLYFAGSDNQILQERKNYNITDYADRQWAATITGVTGNIVTLTSVTNAVLGYSLCQNISGGQVGLASVITNINPVAKTVTTALALPYTNGAAIIAQGIQQTLTYCPLTCGYPNFIKKFQPVLSFVFGQAGFTTAVVGFSTDFYQTQENVTLLPKFSGGWGTFPFGTVPFGVSSAFLQGIPVFLTKNTFMAHWLNISVTMQNAFENMELSGIYAFYDIFGERSR